MVQNSNTGLCDYTFNPWYGCTKISPGCDSCWGEIWAKRRGLIEWGGERRLAGHVKWQQPFKWARRARETNMRPKVFCASLGDVFDDQVPPSWREDLWSMIRATPELDWMLLTKRPENFVRYGPPDWGDGWPHVMLGVSVEDERYVHRISTLLRVAGDNARVFISYEPVLGPIGLLSDVWRPGDRPRLSWLICGGESGAGARPVHPDWIRAARDQCVKFGVSFFFRQWGEWALLDPRQTGRDGKTVTCHRWPDGTHMFRVGTKLAGEELDGRLWRQMPQQGAALR